MRTKHDDHDAIVSAVRAGEHPRVVGPRYGLTTRQVQLMVRQTNARSANSHSLENTLTPQLRKIIRWMMEQEGRNFSKCELCGDPIPKGKAQIHHTKYEGATYYDLRIVDAKCNLAPENRYLQ